MKKVLLKMTSALMALALVFGLVNTPVHAIDSDSLEEGRYTIGASLSCYVNAMGGIEFGTAIYDSARIDVDSNGEIQITINLKSGSISIYGVKASMYVDPQGIVQYHDGVTWVDSEHTTYDEDGTIIVSSMTLPVSKDISVYNLGLKIESTMMGSQFGGEGASREAILTLDWSDLTKIMDADEVTTQSSQVSYNISGSYEVSIPSTIQVDTLTNTADYTVEANNFVLGSQAYVKVTTEQSGSLSNGTTSLSFTNGLDGTTLRKTGDVLNGQIVIAETPSQTGNYIGTVDFNIEYYSGQ